LLANIREKTSKTEEKKNPRLEAAIGGLSELYDGCSSAIASMLNTAAKKAALKRAQDYISGKYDRWVEVRDGLKKHVGYDDMKKDERERVTNNLRYLRQIVGVAARPTKKRIPPKIQSDSDDNANSNSARVILPDVGTAQNERLALVNQVLTALDEAFACDRSETVELILLATQQAGKEKARKNAAA
jgi:hypothetical protein